METITNEESMQKCWYCKRNYADPKYLNIEERRTTSTKIVGIKKYTSTNTREWKVERCKECYEIHKKGEFFIGISSLISYFASYVLLCYWSEGIGDWIKYILFIFAAAIPLFVVMYILQFFIGHYYAYKYKVKTKWAKGGDII